MLAKRKPLGKRGLLWYNIAGMGILEKPINFIKDRLKNLSGEEKRRLVIIGTVVFCVLLTISVFMSLKGSPKEELPFEPDRSRLNAAIPAEDLFLPDEPDFIPGVLLERERRTSWTEEDAAEYWQNPLVFGEEQWRRRVVTAVDELLENVP